MAEQMTLSFLDGEVDGYRRVELAAVQPTGQLVGAARIIDISAEEGELSAVLSDVLVLPEVRRQGIARGLVQVAKKWADFHGAALYLHVRPENPALQLYLDEGFEDFHGRKTDEGSLWLIKLAHEGRLRREGVERG